MEINLQEISKIFINSVGIAFKWRIWKWLIVSSIGALSSTLQFGEKFFHWDNKRSIIFGLSCICGLYILRFILVFIKESMKYFHEVYTNSVYGEAIILLKDSFASTHFYKKTPGHQDVEFMKSMILFCNNLQIIFQNIIKDDCSVSIKIPISSQKVDEKTVFMNLTRDFKHNSRDTRSYIDTQHTLIGNTAFSSVFNKVIKDSEVKYYINNSVNITSNYDNTSKGCYTNGILPYNSEFVFPIIPCIKDKFSNLDCHGFICIDSIKLNAFSGKYIVSMLEGVADGLYDIISQRNQSKS